MRNRTVCMDILTTGEAAHVCGVAPRTVTKWFDSGVLQGYKIPGSKDRRIPRESLIRFMKKHGIPINGLMNNNIRLLAIDKDKDITDVLKLLGEKYEVEIANNDLEAGMLIATFKPDVILLDSQSIDIDRLGKLLSNAVTKFILASEINPIDNKTVINTPYLFLKKPYQLSQVAMAIDHVVASS